VNVTRTIDFIKLSIFVATVTLLHSFCNSTDGIECYGDREQMLKKKVAEQVAGVQIYTFCTTNV
jgi:hypothetical protein